MILAALTLTITVVAHEGPDYSGRVPSITGLDRLHHMRIEVESHRFPGVTKWHVRRVLNWIGQQDLEGLKSISVIDDCPNDREYVALPRYLMGFLYNGHYSRKEKGFPAEIVLYANDIYFGIPTLLIPSPMTTLRVARTLAHEVGHHVIATRGYIYNRSERYSERNGKRDALAEKTADSYASAVIGKMLTHWFYKLGRSVARTVSNALYQLGLADYWAGDYQAAASKLARARTLNLENEDAGQCFRHAMEKLKAQSPSPLTTAEREWIIHKYNPTPMSTGILQLKKKPDRSPRTPGR